ncbi:Superoxide dismutase [Cu-Zn] [Perkinsus olseni]|uniref:Superoxide dismutase [Cu-Zn] n=1 Tax=Perkinsus olseni TaxID=32597 RepID=A0A7J6L9E1_PEROL|nr:Superoxide dismutase [Cu-Zn] [Perkinsus olseni]
MLVMRLILLLPLAAAELRSSHHGKGGNACNDLCKLIPGCSKKGSHCKFPPNPKHPALCQDLHFVKAPHSSNATACSVWASGSKCPTDYPVRCDDIQPFDPYRKPRFPHKAHAKLEGYGKKKGDYGHVYFEEEYYDKTKVTYEIHNLKPHGVYGMYVHERSSFHPHGCKSTGGVYDPFYNGPKYGYSKNKAVGDLGYIKADARGVAHGHFYHQYVMVEGPISVVHRPVV